MSASRPLYVKATRVPSMRGGQNLSRRKMEPETAVATESRPSISVPVSFLDAAQLTMLAAGQ